MLLFQLVNISANLGKTLVFGTIFSGNTTKHLNLNQNNPNEGN